jgi:dTDP-4-amino-4,6-dideoxygalactose transaminase
MMIPLVDLAAQQAEIDDEMRVGLDEVFAKTAFIGGQQVQLFESAYAAYVGTSYCVGVANGTDALELALRAVGVSAGGQVIMPANTFIATAEAVSRVGAVPVLVDVDDHHLLIDPALVERALTPRTQAIIPVHLFGQTAFVEQLQPLADAIGVPIVEDAAQAQGARRLDRPAGSLGVVAATSFYPGKNLGAAGDAGAVTTSDPDIARTVRLLGAHGSSTKYVHEIVGVNSRLDTVQAVVLGAKLARLTKWNEWRRQAAARYAELLADIPKVRVPRSALGNEDVWHLYVVRTPHRDQVLAKLNAAGVGAGIHYPTPIHLTPAYAHLGLGPGSFPVAEQAAAEILSLPLHPHLTFEQQEYVAAAVGSALALTRETQRMHTPQIASAQGTPR